MSELPSVKRFASTSGARVYRIAFHFMPELSGRVYLVLGAGPATLVDAGTGRPEAMADILAGLQTVSASFDEPFQLGDLERIVVTHAHADHIGGLAELVRRTGAEVAVHALDSREVVAPAERLVLARRRFETFLVRAGISEAERPALRDAFARTKRACEPVPVDCVLEDGQSLEGLRIHHTPGHSPGHICIQVGDLLLVGDHVLARTITQLWPESGSGYCGLGHYLESLTKVELLRPVTVALGGHEAAIHDFHQRIGVVRGSHLRRLERVRDLLRQARRPLTLAEIAQQLYAGQVSFYGLLALTDVAARVEYLEQRGRLSLANLDEIAHEENPVLRYLVVD